jgi:hypothetical protein
MCRAFQTAAAPAGGLTDRPYCSFGATPIPSRVEAARGAG